MVAHVTDPATNHEIEISREALKASIRKHGAPDGERLLADLTDRVHFEWLQQFPFDEGGYWLLIFKTRADFVPGWHPVTLIVTDTGLRVCSWFTTDGRGAFNCAHFHSDQGKHKLILFRGYGIPGVTVDTFTVTPDNIVKVSSQSDITLALNLFP